MRRSIRSTIIERRPSDRAYEQGSAAFEVLLLLPFILLIWMLLVNMSYSGIRHIRAGAAMNLGAFTFVSGLTTADRNEARESAQSLVNQAIFPGDEDPATVTVSGQDNLPADFPTDLGFLGGASSREVVELSVERSPPYADLFERVPLRDRLIVAANTWTYCEMKDEDFSDSAQAQALNGLNLVGDYALWLFGGCGGEVLSFACEDRCGS
jgi:hypothetical protein